ncbi:SNF2 family N-terminal domain-containing protein [Lophiotrema nucula]|uniref:SNF2 family N-terminal domain-containing protein n=1 Tax=Lophiotrema nucula TaxID=690887 RepID=A0A6A5YPC3_9PLEO|nr:SNF2 family N-terminal domain-containing protein [Lophiotrema nucula]
MAPGHKRPIESIDLTDDDFSSSQPFTNPSSSQGYLASQPSSSQPRPAKQARVGHNRSKISRTASAGSQADPLFIDDGDEDDGSQEVPDGSQSNEAVYRYELYGVLQSKIVGIQYYRGYVTQGEYCVLRREPHNPYDRNAIQALNVQGVQIGHVPKTWAAKLAKYMDNGSLILEGKAGRRGDWDIELEIRLYGTNEPTARENLMHRLKSDRLPIGHAADRKRKEEKAERERQKLAAQVAKRAKKNGGAVVGVGDGINWDDSLAEYAASSSQGFGSGPTLEDIVRGSQIINPRHVEQAVEQFGLKEGELAAMPPASQPEALLTELRPFQLQGLQWMLEKENPRLPAEGTKDIVQLWQRHPTERNAFMNLATHFSIPKPILASGGILADDMGLGKTIQVISLIMADRVMFKPAPGVSTATLILAPVSVMSNWSTQMKQHIKEKHALRVLFYHGTRKEPITPDTISNYDVVISTYESVSSEWHSQKSTNLPRKSGVFSVTWRRVVLDEGHSIRNPKAKKTIAVTNLMAQSRWALTGTPIINNLKDLYSLVRFLRLTGGLEKFDIFHGSIIRPVNQGEVDGNRSLQLLMKGTCLRRKKDMAFIDLRLPELSEYVHKITLLPHEQQKYDALEAQAKGKLDTYRTNLNKSNKNSGKDYQHLLEVLLRMRQLCNHWKLMSEERLTSIMQEFEVNGAVDLTEENKEALQNMLQLAIESQEDCPVCFDSLKEPVITTCAHIYCSACIEKVIELQHKCPMCRNQLESLATTTVKPKRETSGPTGKDKLSLDTGTSSKVEALLSILKASAKDRTNKTIIFSQWTSFLDILQPHLSNAGFTYTRIDGSMTAPQRDIALEALDSDTNTTIMLASLSVCSVGLNLVAANQVIIADSWWAPAIEDQAIDRVHRLGQKRDTKVFRLVVERSVEERVLSIQEEKRKLVGLAMGEKGQRRAGAGLGDLERLLGGRQRRQAA